MRFDLHCHTREGSIDARASIFDIAARLQAKGFDGMLVTDHNSFDGFDKCADAAAKNGFVILRGIEYDTSNAGHMLVILPDKVKCRLLEIRGMGVEHLIKLVHSHGGILGPAHPYGTGFFALMHTRWSQRHMESLLDDFDFVETCNSGVKHEANARARRLAQYFGKVQTGGSDVHHLEDAGLAYTDISGDIRSNNELIAAIRRGEGITAACKENPHGSENKIIKNAGIAGYWVMNKATAALRLVQRRHAEKHI